MSIVPLSLIPHPVAFGIAIQLVPSLEFLRTEPPMGVGRFLGLLLLFGQFVATKGASVAAIEPRNNTILVEEVVAGELTGSGADFKLVHTNRTRRGIGDRYNGE
nr:hypothetical protein Itr_chr07CG13030 [Ipomoea trifida]